MIRKTISCMAIAVAAILTSVYTLTGCQSHQGDENQLENDIDSFATYYFNWQFPKTLKYCTQSSTLATLCCQQRASGGCRSAAYQG